jgi:hypothetical protein
MTTATEEHITTDLVPVLWMDNQPKNVTLIKKFIDQERKFFHIRVDVVTTIEDARKKLHSGEYGAFVADCQMDDFDFSVNGAEFLREMADYNPALPRFVYSSYLEDTRYEQLIEESAVTARASKVDEKFVPPLAAHDFFQKLEFSATRFVRVKDLCPEKIAFREYLANPNRYTHEVSSHWQKHGTWITATMNAKQWVWCVVIGTSVALGSGDLADFPTDTALRELGERFNLIPFAYSGILAPEEVPGPARRINWNTTSYVNDSYPTLQARLNGVDIQDDFDTGAYCTFVSSEIVPRDVLNFPQEGEHLGKTYQYFTTSVPIELTDNKQSPIKRELAVIVVENWHESPFVKINPSRRCLFGRDLLRAFPVAIVLNSKSRLTEVRYMATDVEGCPFMSNKQICIITQ